MFGNFKLCFTYTGQFGDVYTAKMNRSTVAVKVIKRYSSKRVKEQFENEMSTMSQVSHHNIVRLHGIIRDGETSRDNILTYILVDLILDRSSLACTGNGVFTKRRPQDIFERKSPKC